MTTAADVPAVLSPAEVAQLGPGPVDALTLTNPYGLLVAAGRKTVETRSWRTSHRGLLAIHTARRFPTPQRALCVPTPPAGGRNPFADALVTAGYQLPSWVGGRLTGGDLPCGYVVAVVELLNCVPINAGVVAGLGIRDQLEGRTELAFGDYRIPGRWAWFLDPGRIRRFAVPVPATGQLGVWAWTPPAP